MSIQNLQQKKCWIDSETKGEYSHHNPIKFLTKSIESSLCDYSDTYILVTGDIAVTGAVVDAAGAQPQRKEKLNAATQVAFKNCTSEINDTFVDYANFINIAMPMYNLIEYTDNYSDTSGSLWGFKRDEVANKAHVANGTRKRVKIALPLKYLSNVWRSWEMPLINCKVMLSLK